jgi:tricorn protease-like protein
MHCFNNSAVTSRANLEQVYDSNRFLDAFRQSSEYWKPSSSIENHSFSDRSFNMRKLLAEMFILAAVSFFSHSAVAQNGPPWLLRFPTVSKTQIVFNYGGDLWIVSRDGGDARRLTSGVGDETMPSFSPDGTMVAFTGEYDRNRDVFVVRATGGVPKRLTS